MKLSAKAENACLAAIALARREVDHPLPVREIAEVYGISDRFLVQILLQLKAAGLVYSTRGPLGGYKLARPPEQISLGEILTAIEGPDEPPREAREPAAKALASVVNHIRAAERAVLDQTSIAHLAGQIIDGDWMI